VSENFANTSICPLGHKSSPVTSHVRPLLSSVDAQFSVSLCLSSRQASPKAEHSHSHGFRDRFVTAAVCFNHLTDAASSGCRRFELTFSDTSSYVGSEVPEFVFDGKYNSKLKTRIVFWAMLTWLSLDTWWFCRFVLIDNDSKTSGFSYWMLLFDRSRCSSCSSPRNDQVLISDALFPERYRLRKFVQSVKRSGPRFCNMLPDRTSVSNCPCFLNTDLPKYLILFRHMSRYVQFIPSKRSVL